MAAGPRIIAFSVAFKKEQNVAVLQGSVVDPNPVDPELIGTVDPDPVPTPDPWYLSKIQCNLRKNIL